MGLGKVGVYPRDEIALVLLGLDTVEEAGLCPDDGAKVRGAIRLLTTKLWPEFRRASRRRGVT
jgi:hypothetical protein